MDGFEEKYTTVTSTLIDYGWVITPFMIGRDFEKIRALVTKINNNNNNPTQAEKEQFQHELNFILTDVIFHPGFRAFFVYRAKEVMHVKKFSHHIERAILHYYNNDYFSTVLLLLPAVEGVLLSYFGWEFGKDRKPTIEKLIKEIEKCRVKTYNDSHYHLYSKSIATFLRKWIFSDTSITDTTYSFLNRHYVLHGMGTGSYYSIADANKLLMFFDLIIEFLSFEQRLHYNFIPSENPSIDNRRDYYFKLIEGNIRRKEMLKTENMFLKENENYYNETEIPNWKEMVARAVKDHLELMKKLDAILGKRGRR